jgi:DNA-binding winged helix-turn-helix (wHTH) protein/TolB-like protein
MYPAVPSRLGGKADFFLMAQLCAAKPKPEPGLATCRVPRLGRQILSLSEKPPCMTSPPPLSAPFRLRDRRVTPARNSVQGPDGETGIEPKIMAVLCVLAAEPGRVFTRAELIDKVWGAEFGADESLTRAISHLRKALGDTRNEPAVIETIAKRGYRLLPDALIPESQAPGSQPPEPPSSAIVETPRARPSNRRIWLIGAGAAAAGAGALLWLGPFARSAGAIALIVLPVNAIQREPSQQSLAAALTVDLVGVLARDRRLHVTVRRPDPNLPKRGRRYSLYADLQTATGELKAHVEIMDFDSDQALWSRLYERPYDGKLSSQDALAQSIARDLTAALLAMQPTKR